jgi:transcriptional regulator with XRE-family HTH domain
METQVSEIVRKLREARSLSVRTLAAKSGFSPSFISQIENGQASPSISSLEKIALALGVSLVEFFGREGSRPLAVVRAKDRPRLQSAWSKAEIERLSGSSTGRLESLLITIDRGGSSGKAPHVQSQEQFVFVVTGEIALLLGGSRQILQAGDAVTISAQEPYRWENESAESAQLLVVSFKNA